MFESAVVAHSLNCYLLFEHFQVIYLLAANHGVVRTLSTTANAGFPSFSLLCYWFDDEDGLIRVEKCRDSVNLLSSRLESEVACNSRPAPVRPPRDRDRPRRPRPRRERGGRRPLPARRMTRSPSPGYRDRPRCALSAPCLCVSISLLWNVWPCARALCCCVKRTVPSHVAPQLALSSVCASYTWRAPLPFRATWPPHTARALMQAMRGAVNACG
jgi:hypothetical protein